MQWLLVVLAAAASVRGDVDYSADHRKVTFGSAIKLTHVSTGYKLHSHAVKYGSGSGQQSVTAFPNRDDVNSYFRILPAFGKKHAHRGDPIPCGATVRLKHVETGNFLHSHLHHAPLSHQQEVSAFDGMNNGDNWIITCDDSSDSHWMRDKKIRLAHMETGFFLSSSARYAYQHPIPGQLEISAVKSSSSKDTLWEAQEGVYFSDNPSIN